MNDALTRAAPLLVDHGSSRAPGGARQTIACERVSVVTIERLAQVPSVAPERICFTNWQLLDVTAAAPGPMDLVPTNAPKAAASLLQTAARLLPLICR